MYALLLLHSAHAEPSPVGASSPTHAFEFTSWGIAAGLPQSTVTDLDRLSDGRLVLSTFGGLALFDGRSMSVVDNTTHPELPTVRVVSVAVDGDDLLLGLQHGGVHRLRAGRIERVGVGPGGPDGPIYALEVSDAGLWAADGRQRLWLWEGETWQVLTPPQTVATFSRSGSGVLAAGPGGILFLDGIAPRTVSSDPVFDAVSVGDTLWTLGPGGLSRVGSDQHALSEVGAMEEGRLAAGPDGGLWIGSGAQLIHVPDPTGLLSGDPTAEAALISWPMQTTMRSLHPDAEGSLWVGTNHNGLVRVHPEPFVRFGVEQGLPKRGAHVVAQWGDDILAVSGCDSLQRLVGARFEEIPTGAPHGCVRALHVDASDTLWIGHNTAVSAMTSSQVTSYREVEDNVLSLHADRDGLWIGGEHSLQRLEDGELVPFDGPAILGVGTISRTPSGDLWFGHRDGVAVLGDSGWTELGAADGLPAGTVRTVHHDADGTSWVGAYGGGLARVRDGHGFVFAEAHGATESVVSQILDDGQHLWLNGNRGVTRVPRDDLHAVANGTLDRARFRLFSTGEGNGGSQPAGVSGPDGRLWFPTLDGIVALDPAAVARQNPQPEIRVQSVSIDGESLPVADRIVALTGERRVVIGFGAAILRHPHLARFEYRLHPLHTSWVSTGGARTVRFDALKPGTYRFEVRVTPEGGLPSPPATVSFELPPRFHETWVFWCLTLASLLMAMLLAIRVRTQRLRDNADALLAEVTQRREAEAALRDSEQHYRSLFEAASDGLLLASPGGLIEASNPSAQILLGVDPIGLQVDGLFGLDGDRMYAMPTEAPRFAVQLGETTFPSGQRLISFSDIGQLIHLQERLAQGERLEAMGRLAGGVAHDFNNLLTVMSANASFLLSMPQDDETTDCLRAIESATDRGCALTRQLLAYGRRQVLRPQVVSPLDLMTRLQTMMRRVLRDDVKLEVPTGIRAMVRVDPAQLELAVMNLVMNAAEAMPRGGSIRLSVVYDEHGWVNLHVEDSGDGIDPQILTRIFEPFFTTHSGVGSGLGLASVQGFVTQSGGSIEVTSEVGTGSHFVLRWPEATPEVVESKIRMPPGPRSRNRVTPQLLLVDDEPYVLDSLATVLSRAGYEVRTARDGSAALDALEQKAVDVLVTDVLMPGLNGAQLAEAARDLQPGLPVVFMSGYTNDVLPGDVVGRFLQKPFRRSELLDAVRLALQTA